MRKITVILILFYMFLPTFIQSTQAQTHNLSAEELADFRENVGRIIDLFQNYLSVLGSKDQPKEVKDNYKKSAPNLFIGEGKAYKFGDMDVMETKE